MRGALGWFATLPRLTRVLWFVAAFNALMLLEKLLY